MSKKIVIAGGTGMIGTRLAKELYDRNYEPVIITRSPGRGSFVFPVETIGWELEALEKELDGAFAVVNLAGVSIGEKWTDEYKQEIRKSRIETTSNLVSVINGLHNPPTVYFNISAVGYYAGAGEAAVDETFVAGDGFLSKVCNDWETEAMKLNSKTRLVIGRAGMVLDGGGGVLKKLLTSFKSYVGGALGTGKQWMSWIHLRDLTGMIIWSLENPEVSGAVNFTSPNPVTMDDFARTLGAVLNKPSFFRVPTFAIKAIMGEASSIVLEGNRVIPARATELGYVFQFRNLGPALKDLFKK